MEDMDKLIDRDSTIVWASCGSVPLQAFHIQLSQPFSNHQVREGEFHTCVGTFQTTLKLARTLRPYTRYPVTVNTLWFTLDRR